MNITASFAAAALALNGHVIDAGAVIFAEDFVLVSHGDGTTARYLRAAFPDAWAVIFRATPSLN